MEKEKFTSRSVKNFETEVDYTTVLDNFEGPLDLLLHLIEQEQIEIKDVFVSQVTEQFLSYMKGLPYIDLDKASEYLDIAATIIDIKARSLLPPPDDWLEDMQEDYDDPKQELIQALEEYREMFREEATKLKERETVGYFFKAPDKDLTGVNIQYKDLTLDGLMKAFSKMLLRLEAQRRNNPPPREIPRDTFTVRDKITRIREVLNEKGESRFEGLFDENASIPEIVTTFQAVLELLKKQFITVDQELLFGEIIIKKNPNISEDEDLGEIDEYN